MKTLSTPRGVLAVSESEKDLEKIMKSWPSNEKLHIGEWKDEEKRNSTRRPRRDARTS